MLRECIKKLKEINDLLAEADRGESTDSAEALKSQMREFSSVTVRHTLNKLRDLFERPTDPLLDRRDARVTYFRLSDDQGRGKVLSYYNHAFPHAVSPNTTEFSEEQDGDSAAIRCLLSENMVIVSDVPDAARVAEEQTNSDVLVRSSNWKTMYPGQPQKYGSMLCCPVVIGRHRDSANRLFVGVVTITVGPNFRNYFREDGLHVKAGSLTDYVSEGFVTDILHPFSLVLAILAEAERSDSILWNSQPNLDALPK